MNELIEQKTAPKPALRVLIVEDNARDIELCLQQLQKTEFEIHSNTATSSQQFVERLQQHPYDIVLADYQLQQWTGLEALELLRRLRKPIPLILVSSILPEDKMAKCISKGIADFVFKDNLQRLPLVIRRVLQEKQTREERARFAEERDRFFMLSPDMLCILGFDGYFQQLNPTWTNTLGFTLEELASEPFLNYVHPEDLARAIQEFGNLLKGHLTASFENRFRCKDGGWKWLQWKSTPLVSQQKIYSSARDITEHKLAEERIREQAALLDKAQEAICVQDMQSRIIFWNKSSERLYGWSAEEIAAIHPKELLYTAESPQGSHAHQTLADQGEWIGELAQQTKSGQKIVVESRWTLVRDSLGLPKSILIINTDITARKHLEVQFLRAQRLESIGKLASGIAHDLNNVLTPILISIELLRENCRTPASQSLLDTLQSQAQHGAEMVKQILSFSRGCSGEKVTVQLKHLIADMANIARDTFPRSIRVETNVARDLWTVTGDATQLHQVLLNLCVNARDAMPQGGALRINAENIIIDRQYAWKHLDAKPGPYLSLTVADSGTGIAPQFMDQLFEPFFTSKEPGKGTGLGLPTVMRIVKGHGGFINVVSEPNQGARFTVYLPASHITETISVKDSPPRFVQGRREQILIVDDEPSFREITRAILEKYNYRVLTASDGNEALTVFTRHKGEISAVITDMVMPVLDGPATIRALREIDPSLPFIATSGLMTPEKLPSSDQAATVPFLLKPFRTDKLLESLHNVLEEKEKAP